MYSALKDLKSPTFKGPFFPFTVTVVVVVVEKMNYTCMIKEMMKLPVSNHFLDVYRIIRR